MVLFLVRHAHAESGEPDETRPLSERGRAEARTLAGSLAQHETPPVLVLSSPLLRARETADEIGRVTAAELRVDERLLPGATPGSLLDAIGDETRPVAAVCHQPDCSEIALALIGHDPGFPPGGVAEIDLGDSVGVRLKSDPSSAS
ncbi:MAG: SixA phosphatase family protein [bacterium]